MIKVEIFYNPYKLSTTIKVDGENVLDLGTRYQKLMDFIGKKVPIQTWIKPIQHNEWKGFLEEIIGNSGETELELHFCGREIDFKDICNSLEEQNEERSPRVKIKFIPELNITDADYSKSIDDVVCNMQTERFKKIIDASHDTKLKEKYYKLNADYKRAKDNEFKIIVAGLFSSGKSTLINSLIGKIILPSADETCTSSNCKIKHKKNVEFAELHYKYADSDKVEIQRFMDGQDAEINSLISELCPPEKKPNTREIDSLEIHTNLSHLYPEGFEDKFNIVIVDTPGTNSGRGNNQTGGSHIETAIEAIQSQSKEIVLITLDGQDYEDESLLDLFEQIQENVEEDLGGYNDRFFFVMNKCDNLDFKGNDNIEERINRFATHLKRVGDDDRMITPSVFPVCAYPAIAIKKGFFNDENIENQDDNNLFNAYCDFKRRCLGKFRAENYQLEKVCDVSEMTKDELETRLQRAIDSGKEEQAVLVHTGIPAIEETIKGYIERYAYPIKTRDILNTFDDILAQADEELRHLQKLFEDTQREQSDAQKKLANEDEKKEKEEKRKRDIEDAKGTIEKFQKKIEEIEFNCDRLSKVIGELDSIMTTDRNVLAIRNNCSFNTEGQAKSALDKVQKLFDTNLNKIQNELTNTARKQEKIIDDIILEFKKFIDEIEKKDLFIIDDFNLKNTVEFQVAFNILKEADVYKAIESSDERKRNPIKDECYVFFAFGKKMKQLLAPNEIVVTNYKINRDFDTEIYKIFIEFNRIRDSLKGKHEKYIGDLKGEISERSSKVLKFIQESEDRLLKYKEDIESLTQNIDEVLIKENEILEDKKWLEELCNEIKIIDGKVF